MAEVDSRPPALRILRVSPRPKDRDVWSEDIQDEGTRRLAEQGHPILAPHGYRVIDTLVAHMTSGADPERETRTRMFELAEAGHLRGGAVLVYTTSRFSREEPLFHIEDVARLQRHGVHVLSWKQPHLDPTADWYVPQLAFEATIAARERTGLIRDTKAGIARAKAAGVWVGRVPFGLRKRGLVRAGAPRTAEGAGLEQDPVTWPELVRLFELRGAGKSLRQLAVLYGRHETTLMAILANRVYRQYLDESNPGLWELAQAAAKTTGHSTDEVRHTYLYRGMLTCPWCGRTMTGRWVHHSQRPGRTLYYICKASHDEKENPHKFRMVSARDLDEAVGAALEEADIILPLAREIEARLAPSIPDLVELADKRRDELEAERKRALTQHRRGYLTDDELDETMAALRKDIASLPTAVDRAPEVRPTAVAMQQLRELIETVDPDDKDEILAANALLRRVLTITVNRQRQVTVVPTPAVAAIVQAAREILASPPMQASLDALHSSRRHHP